MLLDTFNASDHDAWHDEPHYSLAVAALLTEVYRSISYARGTITGFQRALDLLPAVSHQRMARHQRLHLYYMLATAHAAHKAYEQALCWLDRALRMAYQAQEIDYQIDLLYFRATLHRSLLRLGETVDDYRDCLALLDRRHALLGLDEPGARLQILPQLAIYLFYMERFEFVEELLKASRELVPLAPEHELDAAAIEWAQAKVYWIQRDLGNALRTILAVQAVYATKATTVTRERLEIDVAGIALDWAETLSPGPDRTAFVRLARTHLTYATRLARAAQDSIGKALIQLARIQYYRVTGSTQDRVQQIQKVIHTAEQLGDVAVLAQAWTALGIEYEACGELQMALDAYQTTLRSLEGTDLPVLGSHARRVINRTREMERDRLMTDGDTGESLEH